MCSEQDPYHLRAIVEKQDTRALESFCLGRTYQQVRDYAIRVGVDLDELEELLASNGASRGRC